MKKSWGLTEKILRGEKTIESRWYKVTCKPWDAIFPGDIVYFKNSGEPVTMQADVDKAIQYAHLTPVWVKAILNEYGEGDGLVEEKISEFFKLGFKLLTQRVG